MSWVQSLMSSTSVAELELQTGGWGKGGRTWSGFEQEVARSEMVEVGSTQGTITGKAGQRSRLGLSGQGGRDCVCGCPER